MFGLIPQLGQSQNLVTDDTVEWYTPADEITAENFTELVVAREWDGSSFNGRTGRSTPTYYVDGKLFTVSGPRRNVVAIAPKTGETWWAYRLPNKGRWKYSMRASYGNGNAYSRIDGCGVVYISTPDFFLVALDAETGSPLEEFGGQIAVDGFPKTGVVDMLANLRHPYDPYEGIPLETGYITASPPIVVNDTIIVGNSAEPGYLQARVENIPGDILAYDKVTGAFKWKFNVIPRPGEYDHEAWENDAWERTGDVSSWAPLTADPENNIVYIPTKPPAFEMQGISEDDLIDFTPELPRQALEMVANYKMGPLFNPSIRAGNAKGKLKSTMCPRDGGGANIYAPPTADPTSGFLYVPSATNCSWQLVIPGEELGRIEVPAQSRYGMRSWKHDRHQYIIL